MQKKSADCSPWPFALRLEPYSTQMTRIKQITTDQNVKIHTQNINKVCIYG